MKSGVVRLLAAWALGFWLGQGVASDAAHRLLEAGREPVNPRYLLAGPGGRAVTNEDFRGRYQLITFGYTFCPDVCPTTLVDMAAVLKGLGDRAGMVQALFVTVDPDRDSEEVLGRYTAFFDPRILGLRGSPELTARAARNFRVRYEKVVRPDADPRLYAVDHSAGIFLVGPDGSLLRRFSYRKPPSEMTAEIEQLIDGR